MNASHSQYGLVAAGSAAPLPIQCEIDELWQVGRGRRTRRAL